MNRKYPFTLFLLMVLVNFVIRYFYLFLPGLVLNIIGIWSRHCLAIGLALWILDLILSVIEQLRIRKTALEEHDNEDLNAFLDAAYDPDDPNSVQEILQEKIAENDSEYQKHQALLENLVVYRALNESIREGMTLDEMIDAFAEMCEISVGEPDDLLFEAGTYAFDMKKKFYFSLVRQFKFMDDDEYVQLHLEVTYLPCAKTRLLYKAKWGSLTDGDFFGMVRSSRAYRVARELPIFHVNVYVDET